MARRLIASTYVTLDGFIDEPGKWSFPFWSEEASNFKLEELRSADALVLGRLTYEGFAAAWPKMRDEAGEFGVKMNDMPKHVASRSLQSATWNATIMQGDVVSALRTLKAEDGGDLLIGGSGQLIDSLTPHGVIDEYRVMIHPVVLGDGTKRLFTGVSRRSFELAGSVAFPKGIVVNTYHPAR